MSKRKENQIQNGEPLPGTAQPTRLAFSMREAAVAIGVSYITMHRMLKRGLIRSAPGLRTKIISKSEIERYLAQ